LGKENSKSAESLDSAQADSPRWHNKGSSIHHFVNLHSGSLDEIHIFLGGAELWANKVLCDTPHSWVGHKTCPCGEQQTARGRRPSVC